MNTNYCYIFDYSSVGVFELDLQSANKKPIEFECEEELIRYWGFHPSNCSWMFSDEKIDILSINKPLN